MISHIHREDYMLKNGHLWNDKPFDLLQNAENGAVIIETRPILNIGRTIKNHLYHLGPNWGLTVITGDHHSAFWELELAGISGVQRSLPIQISAIEGYNRFLLSKKFWTFLASRYKNRVLIFQHDSLLLRSGIEEFMEWDYVGAPWKFSERGGNGGLSLRNPNIMLDILNGGFPYLNNNEDVYFSEYVSSVGGKMAPREVCKKFSVESIFALGTLGLHDVEEWLSDEEVEQIYNQYK